MQKCLLKQLGRNAHVYVDDVVVKMEKRGTLLEDLKETFENFRQFQIKPNPEKCIFGVPAGCTYPKADLCCTSSTCSSN